MLTETHLNNEIKDAGVNIQGFDLYRCDRTNFKNGGVIIYARSSLNLGIKQLHSLSHNKIELLILECLRINCILVCIYRQPDADGDSFYYVIDEQCVKINENEGELKTIIMAGNFNFPNINWKMR